MPKAEKLKRTSKGEVDRRIKQIVQFYQDGRTRTFVHQYAAIQGWDLHESRIDHYIAEANKLILEYNKANLEENLAIISGNYWSLYREAMVQNNLAEARQAMTALAKLKGLDKLVINHVIDDRRDTEALSDEELDALLAEESSHFTHAEKTH